MGIFDFFIKGKKAKSNTSDSFFVASLSAEVAYKKIAIDSCIDMISNSILKAEFQTYEKGKKTRKSLYYLLNVRPNKNMNQKIFLKKIVYELLYNNECLIVQTGDGELVIADSFVREEKATKESNYSFVTVGDYQYSKVFYEGDVLYLTYYEDNIRQCIDSLYHSYGKLLTSAINIYKRSNAKRYVLKGEFLRSQNDDYQKAVDQMINSQMKPWLEADNAGAVYQLQKDYSLEEANGKSQNSMVTSKDTREIIDHFYNLVSTAFHVPKGLFKGEAVELSGQVDALLNFISVPIIEIFTSEINAKMYSETEFLDRTYVRANTYHLKTSDVSSQATSLDKLFQIGVLCIDDVIEMMGGEPFDEDWSKKRYVTKNYGEARKIDKEEGGGENES